MLRRNPQTGQWERKEGEQWVPAHNTDEVPTDLDIALDAAFSDTGAPADADRPSGAISGELGAPSAAGTAVAADEARGATPAAGDTDASGAAAQGLGLVGQNGTAGGPDAAGAGDVGNGAGAVDSPGIEDWDLPGLVSTDTARSTSGTRGLRKKLQERARGKRTAAKDAGREAKTVAVGPRAAKPVGPAVKDSTAARQSRRAQRGAGPAPARYVTKPAPELIGKRAKWIQDLFEAHFRSEITLAMRRAPSGDMRADGTYPNRMKISRQDYAIGWLTLFDKIKEDPSIIRSRDGLASQASGSTSGGKAS